MEQSFLFSLTCLQITLFNLCNPDGVNGVDCGLAYDELLTNPAFAEQVRARYGGTPADFGLLVGPIGAAETTPVVTVRGDRNYTHVEDRAVPLCRWSTW